MSGFSSKTPINQLRQPTTARPRSSLIPKPVVGINGKRRAADSVHQNGSIRHKKQRMSEQQEKPTTPEASLKRTLSQTRVESSPAMHTRKRGMQGISPQQKETSAIQKKKRKVELVQVYWDSEIAIGDVPEHWYKQPLSKSEAVSKIQKAWRNYVAKRQAKSDLALVQKSADRKDPMSGPKLVPYYIDDEIDFGDVPDHLLEKFGILDTSKEKKSDDAKKIQAATTIQSCWRKYWEARIHNDAAFLIQKTWKGFTERRSLSLAKLAQPTPDEENPPPEVQAAGIPVARWTHYVQNADPVIRIQSLWRSKVTRQTYIANMEKIVILQQHWKRVLEERRAETLEKATRHIQVIWRAKLKLRSLRRAREVQCLAVFQRYKIETEACLKIQACWRNHLQRKRSNLAATVIQSWWKMIKARKTFKTYKFVADSMKSAYKIKKHRKLKEKLAQLEKIQLQKRLLVQQSKSVQPQRRASAELAKLEMITNSKLAHSPCVKENTNRSDFEMRATSATGFAPILEAISLKEDNDNRERPDIQSVQVVDINPNNKARQIIESEPTAAVSRHSVYGLHSLRGDNHFNSPRCIFAGKALLQLKFDNKRKARLARKVERMEDFEIPDAKIYSKVYESNQEADTIDTAHSQHKTAIQENFAISNSNCIDDHHDMGENSHRPWEYKLPEEMESIISISMSSEELEQSDCMDYIHGGQPRKTSEGPHARNSNISQIRDETESNETMERSSHNRQPSNTHTIEDDEVPRSPVVTYRQLTSLPVAVAGNADKPNTSIPALIRRSNRTLDTKNAASTMLQYVNKPAGMSKAKILNGSNIRRLDTINLKELQQLTTKNTVKNSGHTSVTLKIEVVNVNGPRPQSPPPKSSRDEKPGLKIQNDSDVHSQVDINRATTIQWKTTLCEYLSPSTTTEQRQTIEPCLKQSTKSAAAVASRSKKEVITVKRYLYAGEWEENELIDSNVIVEELAASVGVCKDRGKRQGKRVSTKKPVSNRQQSLSTGAKRVSK